MLLPGNLVNEQYCYLTTTGRTSGEPREIEIWFGAEGGTLYLMAGGREKAHWVRNLDKTPTARVRAGAETFEVRARRVEESGEEARARKLLLDKYAPGYSGDLSTWGRTALPIALDLEKRRGS
jgi:deazaflavin-dependent oxidoreductase (nitroreductase family)